MFEILKVVETAKSENNKFLRFFYLNYVKFKLKNTFFKKFDTYVLFNDIEITKTLLGQLKQIRDCHIQQSLVDFVQSSNSDYPYISGMYNHNLTDYGNIGIIVNYHLYGVILKLYNDEYIVEVKRRLTEYSEIESWKYTGPRLPYYIKEIIFMAIYNYCVSYIYGENSKLYKDDESYVKNLKELF